MMHRRSFIAGGLLLPFATRIGFVTAPAQAAAGTYGVSLFGDLKYGPDFKNFDYVNPNAPSGGTIRYAAIGTFDNLNPFVIKGIPASGIGGTFDTLTVRSEDEPSSEYGLVAEKIELAPDQ